MNVPCKKKARQDGASNHLRNANNRKIATRDGVSPTQSFFVCKEDSEGRIIASYHRNEPIICLNWCAISFAGLLFPGLPFPERNDAEGGAGNSISNAKLMAIILCLILISAVNLLLFEPKLLDLMDGCFYPFS